MNEQYYQTLKSVETEDWLDFHIIRPFCFQLARLFAKFDIHPNTVTIWSIIIGAATTFLFASGCYYYEPCCHLLPDVGRLPRLYRWSVGSSHR